MCKLFYLPIILLFLTPLNVLAQDGAWYYPIGGFENRSQYKTFNQYWGKGSYVGKEKLFPTQFTGYHVADDLEISQSEENQSVPVYAVADGKITFTGSVSGYGGLLLLNIANDSHTALYGHIKLSSLKVKSGDSVKAGQELAVLGKGFSSETGGERKHLHFGIYNGKGIYYHGYESSEATVRSKWVDPTAYLRSKGAVEVNSPPGNTNQNAAVGNNNNVNVNNNVIQPDASATQTDQNAQNKPENKGFISGFLQYLESMLNKIRSII